QSRAARRLLHLASLRHSPFFAVPVVDAETYVTMARAIAAGDWAGGRAVYWQPPLYPYLLGLGFGGGVGPLGLRGGPTPAVDGAGGRAVYWQPPLYPYLLALGFGVGFGPLGLRLVQFGVGGATGGLVAYLGTRFGGRRVGLLAGLGAALYGPALFFEGRLL